MSKYFSCLLFPNFSFCCLDLPPPGVSLLMNGFELTACLEFNLLLFLSRILSVVASWTIRVARPSSHPKLGVRGVFAWLVGENPDKELPGIP